MTREFRYTIVWLIGSFVTVLMALNTLSASLIDGHYTPVSNDSFYHARRILDTAADPRNFFEYDTRIHIPEGSQIAWPWTYDYLLANIVRAATSISAAEPETILAYIPVAAITISIALLVATCITLNVSPLGTLLATLCVAFLHLTQLLHGVGIVDHHYAEYIFALAALWAGLRWMQNPGSVRNAVLVGGVLGLAPGFHNGMFILQAPLLAVLGISWLRNVQMPKTSSLAFGGALLVSSLLVLVPSSPFQQFRFEFYLLSWFHLYIAFCTALWTLAFSVLPMTRRNVAMLAGGMLVALLPLLGNVALGTHFIAGDLDMLKNIVEVKSILALIENRGLRWVVGTYSALVFTIPIVAATCLWLTARQQSSLMVRYFAIASLCGLSLMAMQLRFHPYGSFALFLPLIVAVDQYARSRERNLLIMLGLTALLAASYVVPARDRLFEERAPGNDSYYGLTRSVYPILQQLCEDAPGVILAGSDTGNYVRYHTNCSIIANNFLLTAQHATKIQDLNERLDMTPEQLLESQPYIRYALITLADVNTNATGSPSRAFNEPKDFSDAKPTLVGALLSADANSLGPQFRMLVDYRYGENGVPLARLFEILPSARAPESQVAQ